MIEKCAKVWLGGRKGVTAPIHVSQYDTAWRFLLTVYDGDSIYAGGEGTAVYMEGRKADQTVFAVPGTFADGVAVVECTAAMTAAVGPIECELRISEDGETVGTANFEIIVEAAPLKGYVASGDDFSAMQQVLDGATAAAGSALASKTAAAASASAAAVSAATAQVQAGMAYKIAPTAAAMTDHEIGYLYTGSETGYTFGGWYYWDGSAWVLGGMSVDPTLTVAGAAADAKIVGGSLIKFNAFDAFNGLVTYVNREVNGVTYTWTGDECKLTGGTAASGSACILFSSTNLPPYIIPGNTYYVKVNSSDPANISLRFLFKDGSGQSLPTAYAGRDRALAIPAGAAKWSVSIYVNAQTTLPENGAFVSNIHFLTSYSNADLKRYSEELVYNNKSQDSNTAAALTYWSLSSAGYSSDNPASPADFPANCYSRTLGAALGNGWFPKLSDSDLYVIFVVSNLVAPNVRTYIVLNERGRTTYRGWSTSTGTTVAWVEVTEDVLGNPNAKMRSFCNSLPTGAVWVNGAFDHEAPYEDAPYGRVAAALGISPENVTHTLLSSTGLIFDPHDDDNDGSFLDEIEQTDLTGYDYLLTHLHSTDTSVKTPVHGVLGSIDDTAESETLAGKVVELVEYVRSSNPKCALILLGALFNWNTIGTSPGEPFTGFVLANAAGTSGSGGYCLADVDRLMHALAKKHRFIYVDWQALDIVYHWHDFTDNGNIHANSDAVYRAMGEYLQNCIEYSNDTEKYHIDENNIIDVTPLGHENLPVTRNGITWTLNDGKITVNGSTVDNNIPDDDLPSYLPLFINAHCFPHGIKPGGQYQISVDADDDVFLQIGYFKNETFLTLSKISGGTDFISIPSDAEGFYLRLWVPASTTLENAAVYSYKVFANVEEPQDLKNSIVNYNAFDLCAFLNHKNETHKGVLYNWIGNNTCNVAGSTTSESGSRNTLYLDYSKLPDGVHAGDELSVTFSGVGVRLQCLYFKDGSTTAYHTTTVTTSREINVPSDAEGMQIRLFVPQSTTVNTTVSLAIIKGQPNANLAANNVERVYTFDDMTHGGYWYLGESYAELYFRDTRRERTDTNFSRLLIPVKKGDAVNLRTIAGSNNAKPYAVISSDRTIKFIYTDSASFTGTINITEDGWLAVNLYNANSNMFRCTITAPVNAVAEGSLFATKDYIQFPAYNDNNVCKTLRYGQTLATTIQHWGIVGASFDSGEVNWTPEGATYLHEMELYDYSCWAHWQRVNGIPDVYHYADGGQNAHDWIALGANTARGWAYTGYSAPGVPSTIENPEINTASLYGRTGVGVGGGCWWKMKADHENGDTKQAFIINLGSNDINNNYPCNDKASGDFTIDPNYDPTNPYIGGGLKYVCGDVQDIGTYNLATDTDTVPVTDPDNPPTTTTQIVPGVYNSYAAYIGAILNRILAVQPDARIFLCTIRSGFDSTQSKYNVWTEYNNVLKAIAALPQYANNVFVVDNGRFGPSYACQPMASMFVGDHPDVLGYQYLAAYWNTMIDYVIQKNYTRFKQTMFIGTGKSYTPIT